jgi:hypothetical protein
MRATRATRATHAAPRARSFAAGAALALGALALTALGAPAAARADAVVDKAADKAAAKILFEAGRAALDEGKLELACPKLAESFRLDPSALGTLLNLAICHERQGKTATAWGEYLEVAQRATAEKQTERAKRARELADKLEPKLSRLELVLGPRVAGLEGLVVTRDGKAVALAQSQVPVPVDPGEHVVTAEAKGHLEKRVAVTVGAEGDAKTVRIDALEPQPSPSPRPPSPPPAAATGSPSAATPGAPPRPSEQASGSGLRVGGAVLLGVGVAAAAVGGVMGSLALAKRDELDRACPSRTSCDPALRPVWREADGLALASTLELAIGGALAVTGVVLLAIPRPSAKTELRVVARPAGGGLDLRF